MVWEPHCVSLMYIVITYIATRSHTHKHSYFWIDTWENGLIERTTSLYESSSNMNMFPFLLNYLHVKYNGKYTD